SFGITEALAVNDDEGSAVLRSTGYTLTLRDRALHHRTAGITTLRTAAESRTRLMLDFAASQRGVGDGQPDILLVPGADSLRLAALVEHLRRQGIVAERAGASFRSDARPYPGFAPRREFPAGPHRVRAK